MSEPSAAPPVAVARIPIGISSCLLGEPVRFDGGHKHDHYITGTLGDYFEFIPICPEMGIGLGRPREPIRLERRDGVVRVTGTRNPALDVTTALTDFARARLPELAGIRGYLFKRASPSCGMERVKVYEQRGRGTTTRRDGVGVYAGVVMAGLPNLPCEEEGRLGDPQLRENFLERVFLYDRWRRVQEQGLNAAALVDFHSRHKYQLLAHNQSAYRRLGRLISDLRARPLAEIASDYEQAVMQAMRRIATPRSHSNVLEHLAGYLKSQLDAGDRRELAETIAEYRQGLLPRIVPITLLRHHFRRHPDPYIAKQYYLSPHPRELRLLNHV